uniref:Uncharacterized protein n=1 Tax=Wuchereria bancrofti TaxID=6293 RepID=A0A1I8ECV0_WUCBA
MAQLYAHKLFTGLTRNTTTLRTVAMCMKRSYAKVASPEDYGDYTDPLEAHEESMKRRQLIATLAGDDRYETKIYYKLENSTRENPNLVPSDFDYRVSRTQLFQYSLFYMKGNRNVAVVATGLNLLIKKAQIMSESFI